MTGVGGNHSFGLAKTRCFAVLSTSAATVLKTLAKRQHRTCLGCCELGIIHFRYKPVTTDLAEWRAPALFQHFLASTITTNPQRIITALMRQVTQNSIYFQHELLPIHKQKGWGKTLYYTVHNIMTSTDVWCILSGASLNRHHYITI